MSFSYYLFYFIFNECSGHYCPLFTVGEYSHSHTLLGSGWVGITALCLVLTGGKRVWQVLMLCTHRGGKGKGEWTQEGAHAFTLGGVHPGVSGKGVCAFTLVAGAGPYRWLKLVRGVWVMQGGKLYFSSSIWTKELSVVFWELLSFSLLFKECPDICFPLVVGDQDFTLFLQEVDPREAGEVIHDKEPVSIAFPWFRSDWTSNIRVYDLKWSRCLDTFLWLKWEFLHFSHCTWFTECWSSSESVNSKKFPLMNHLFNARYCNVSHTSV